MYIGIANVTAEKATRQLEDFCEMVIRNHVAVITRKLLANQISMTYLERNSGY